MMKKFVVGMCLLVVFSNGQAQDSASALNNFKSKLSSGGYPHILGAVVSTGKKPDLLIMSAALGYQVEQLHDIRSATKSITALLFGLEQAHYNEDFLGKRISSLLPNLFENVGKNTGKHKITISDLLTMRSGLACNDWQPASVGHEDKMYQTNDWSKFWAKQPLAHVPGKQFNYCTGNAIVLGQALMKFAGLDVDEFAQQKLFNPLGIENIEWARTPEGGIDTGGHLRISVVDMHKIGLLVLNHGNWGNVSVVPSLWVDTITAHHSDIDDRREKYGMLWWRMAISLGEQQLQMIYAHGNGGNFIIVIPQINLVAAFVGNAYNSREQFIPLQILQDEIIPALYNK